MSPSSDDAPPALHVELAQVRAAVHVREREPESVHVVAYEQLLHEPQLAATHVVPVVEREQPRVSVSETVAQLPAAHTPSEHERDSVPLSSHESENPAHAPHAAQLLPAHESPVVVREQARVSVPSVGTHELASHAQVRVVRLWVPDSEQVLG
ncbi:MAG: hypothetical protein M3Y87_37205 [Myxococcota bacterium]|nr:hypothetical protein [Myxococcota bacterium]